MMKYFILILLILNLTACSSAPDKSAIPQVQVIAAVPSPSPSIDIRPFDKLWLTNQPNQLTLDISNLLLDAPFQGKIGDGSSGFCLATMNASSDPDSKDGIIRLAVTNAQKGPTSSTIDCQSLTGVYLLTLIGSALEVCRVGGNAPPCYALFHE